MAGQTLKTTGLCLALGIALFIMAPAYIAAQEKVPLLFLTNVMNPVAYSVDHYINHYALHKGKVQAEGTKLDMKQFWARDINRLMLAGEGDVGAIALNAYLMARDRGLPLVMIAVQQIVLPETGKSTNMMFGRVASGVNRVKDLEGKKVGFPGLASASAIYHKAILQHKYGIDVSKITWIDKGLPELFTLLRRGEIDGSNLYGGIGERAMKEPGLEVLYWAPAVWKEMTGMSFLTMTIAAKKSVVEKHPEALKSLLRALKQSRKYGEEHKKEILAEAIKEFGSVEEPGTIEQPFELAEEHRKVVMLYAKYSLEQKIIRKEPAPADLFADLK